MISLRLSLPPRLIQISSPFFPPPPRIPITGSVNILFAFSSLPLPLSFDRPLPRFATRRVRVSNFFLKKRRMERGRNYPSPFVRRIWKGRRERGGRGESNLSSPVSVKYSSNTEHFTRERCKMAREDGGEKRRWFRSTSHPLSLSSVEYSPSAAW